jgi:hypothetical protein
MIGGPCPSDHLPREQALDTAAALELGATQGDGRGGGCCGGAQQNGTAQRRH